MRYCLNGRRREPIGRGIIVQPAHDTHRLPDWRASAVIKCKAVRAGKEPACVLRLFDDATRVNLNGHHLYVCLAYRFAKDGG